MYVDIISYFHNKELTLVDEKVYKKRLDKNSILELIKSKRIASSNLSEEILELDKELKDIDVISDNNSDNEKVNNIPVSYYVFNYYR